MRARLVDLQTGDVSYIDKPVFRIGREMSYVDLCIADLTISRCHCNILCKNGGWYVTDCNSTNRTYVNGTPAHPHAELRLHCGDTLQLACVRYRFEEVS